MLLTGARLTHRTLAIVLAGGRGERLGSLTDWRAKPAVPFGGKFRIIDFTLSNCVNSGIRRIGICTQYKAQSLIRHVQRGWSFLDGRFQEFIELLPAQQRVSANWYRGTADAVFQNIDILRRHDPAFVLVLAGDHVYKMNYGRMIEEHVERGADMTIGCVAVPLEDATQFGVMGVEDDFRVTQFMEKSSSPAPMPGRADMALASMGIYVFNAAFLYAQLARDEGDESSSHDFGRDIIPHLVREGGRLYAHHFADSCVNITNGVPYWRDVGTIDAYWAANLELTRVTPDLNLYDKEWPIWTYQEQLPPAKFVFDDDDRRGHAVDALVSGGCIISGSTVRRSVLFSGVRTHSNALVEDSVILANCDIGRRAVLRRVVLDAACRIPPDMRIGVDPVEDGRRFHVTAQGIILVTPEMLGQRRY
ncbi:MAG: glucose-1-phosphate adenylyltransferase [Betaproteobacteria bacterium RIFCSPLOWO2_12_FULL_63_13]|nr:MAG: glucose-1-phosphate adenylyltransferase [Betaproteobacteria bacterium RIFCSPLOWO2_02_FULL_63_19]OGA54639.1 MAG: glucose-1-phosphate adenylyltransferase [Betaproteobacteria bacterium RIFCSPLOWO2_12_FULL_63_13]